MPDPDYCPEVNIGNGSNILGDNGGATANEIEEVEAFESNSDTEENKSVKVAMTKLYDMFVPQGVHKPLIQAERCIEGVSSLHLFVALLKEYFYRIKRNTQSTLLCTGATLNELRHTRGNITRAIFHPSKTAIHWLLTTSSRCVSRQVI